MAQKSSALETIFALIFLTLFVIGAGFLLGFFIDIFDIGWDAGQSIFGG